MNKSFLNSISFKLVLGLLIFIIPFLLLLVFNNLYTIKTVRNQLASSNKNIVSLYLKQIDNYLREVDTYLADLSVTNTDIPIIETALDEDEYILAVIRIAKAINNDILRYKYIDSFFMYSLKKQEFLQASNERISIDEGNIINSYIKKLIDTGRTRDEIPTRGWHVQKINKDFYLFRILKIGDVYVGAWLKASTLLVPLSGKDFGNSSVSIFITNQGEPMDHLELVNNNSISFDRDIEQYYLTGKSRRFLVVGKKSNEGDFSIVAVTPDDKILSGFPYIYIQWVVTFIAATTAIFLPLYMLLLRITVLVPLNRILSAMKMIREGNLGVRIKPYRASEEFLIVNATFNDMLNQISDMLNQIKKLKIDVYEEKIRRQKAELEHLQLQVKPHFFLNSLNIMNTLARTRNYKLLQEMCMCLIEYFRYVFRSNMSYVYLGDELKHVRNYIHIQEMRFPERLCSEIEAPEHLLNILVPPLLIHTFVENTVKHSITCVDKVCLSIRVCLINSGQEPEVRIVIQDTGKGFDDEILRKLQSGSRIVDKNGEHIGIRNAQQRLQMLYNGKARIYFSNGEPCGAVVEIILPLDQKDLNGGSSYNEIIGS